MDENVPVTCIASEWLIIVYGGYLGFPKTGHKCDLSNKIIII